MQDPWHSDFYENKPKHERPKKYWFSYHLNKTLEPIAMKQVDGIISVSQGYCDMLQERYPNIKPENCTVIPFGAFDKDFEVLEQPAINSFINQNLENHFGATTAHNKIKCVYVGRGGADMAKALRIIFGGFKLGLELKPDLFTKISFQFVGTSYAPGQQGIKTIAPVAEQFGVQDFVTESPARVPYFTSLALLKNADLLIIPGSEDPNYTASKLYPYIMSKKPLLAVFSATSSVVSILKDTKAGEFITFEPDFDAETLAILQQQFYEKLANIIIQLPFMPNTNWQAFEPYTAERMTEKQVDFFKKVI
jgi:hypothetical protein